jgi:hypothetical protein
MDCGLPLLGWADGLRTAAAEPLGSYVIFTGVVAGQKLLGITGYDKIVGVARPRCLNVASSLFLTSI